MNRLSSVDSFLVGPESVFRSADVGLDRLQQSPIAVNERPYLVARGNDSDVEYCVSAIRASGTATICRFMDRVFFVMEPSGLGSASYAFFETVASEYEALISPEQNSLCAQQLVQSALSGRSANTVSTVLDFGCGIGISSCSMRKDGTNVIAYDACPAMRDQARSSGLSVVDSLSECLDGSIDAIVACYVLHFGLQPSDAIELFRILPPGGVLAANFHKSTGMPDVAKLLEAAGFVTIQDLSAVTRSFGPILRFLRRQ